MTAYELFGPINSLLLFVALAITAAIWIFGLDEK